MDTRGSAGALAEKNPIGCALRARPEEICFRDSFLQTKLVQRKRILQVGVGACQCPSHLLFAPVHLRVSAGAVLVESCWHA